MVVLARSSSGSLFGIDPVGGLHDSSDGGQSWTARGSAGGPPEALTVHADGGSEVLYVAARGRGILESDDGGASFVVRHRSG